jgi:hypothetical protein
MGQIYQHAYVTIAATYAHNGMAGLHAKPRLRLTQKPLPSHPLYVSKITTQLSMIDQMMEYNDDFPLLFRGWVLQERLLSQRMVHFLNHKVVFECKSGVRDEDHLKLVPHQQSTHLSLDRNQWSLVQLSQFWRKIIVGCSYKNFSFEEDRLPAIAALAQRMLLLRPGDEYLAGLWKSTLLEDLTWYSHMTSKRTRPMDLAAWKAPSWSWVSVSTSVSFCSGWVIPDITLVDVSYRQDGVAHLGQILDASITIQAQILDFQYNIGLQNIGWGTRVKFPQRGCGVETATTFIVRIFRLDDADRIIRLRPDIDLETDATLQFFSLRYTNHTFYGLVLRKISSDDIYQRIGFMEVAFDGAYIDVPEDEIWDHMKAHLSPFPLRTIKIV